MNEFLVKGGAFVAFVALLSGFTYGAYQAIPSAGIEPRGLVLDPVERSLSVSPGSLVSVGLVVLNKGPEPVELRLGASDPMDLAADSTITVTAPAGESSGGWVTLDVPADATPGDRRVRFFAEPADGSGRRVTTTASIEVLGLSGGLEEGQSASVHYVGRLADGRLFNTNLPPYLTAPMPKADFYRPSSGELGVTTGEAANTIPGFWRGLIGMHVGETRTVVIPSEEAYGPRFVEEYADRRSVVEREFRFPVSPINRPYTFFQDHVTASGQGDPASFGVNDTFTLWEGPNMWTFRLTAVSNESVTYVPAPNVGDTFTTPMTAAWVNGSIVSAVNDSEIVFYTSPTTRVGEPFTFFDYWPGASTVESMNGTHVVVAHTPAEGLRFTVEVGGQPQVYTITRVEEDVITQTFESPNPLAGETLYFDVRLLAIEAPVHTS